MHLAPVALFLYNRPDHTKKTLEYLSRNKLSKDTDLFVFIDGPKNQTDEKRQSILVQILSSFEGNFKSIKINHSPSNRGLAKSITEGVSSVVNAYKRVIVLEDDILTSTIFLTYMNKCLDIYEESKNVFSINGYMFPISTEENTTFLSPLATSSWGWATWADRWKMFSMDMPYEADIKTNEFLTRRFNIGDLNYVDYMNNNNSWAIKWYYSAFVRNGLGLFPTKSLVQNIGFDGSGTNCGATEVLQNNLSEELPKIELVNTINLRAEALLLNYFKTKRKKRGFRAFASKIKSYIKKIAN